MKVLIIGGTGNISTAITLGLLQRGVELTLLKRSAAVPAGMEGVRVIVGDRTDRATFARQLQGAGRFDCVMDMVCYEPEDAACAAEALAGRTDQFVFCSTVDVYSKNARAYPIREDTGEIRARPSFAYAWKKVKCEERLWESHQRGDFALTIIRPAFTYNETWSPGIHSFGGQTYHLDRLRKGLPIILHGDGTSTWVATHRDDVALAFVNAAGHREAYGQDYNVAGDEWMTQNHIWRTIARLMSAPEPKFVYIPTDLLGQLAPEEAGWCVQNFRYNNLFDCAKAKRDLDFRYTIPFEEGARRCIDYLTRHNAIEDCAGYPFYDRIVSAWRRHAAALVGEFRPQPE
jgi:nucleoside-diphosphate-sugar epimerase